MTKVSVGQQVRVPFGVRTIRGTVVEDRGPLGVGGRRLYMVEVPNDPEEPDLVMRAEDEIEADTTPDPPLSLDEIQQYLSTGGLVSILRRNMSGGRRPVLIWLCRDSLGNVTFTFDEPRGLAGGARVPLSALCGEKIFTPKVAEIVEYVISFGLSRSAAQAVVKAVGQTSSA